MLRVDVRYDSHPEHASWVLLDAATGAIVVQVSRGSVTTLNAVVSRVVPTEPGKAYRLILRDSYGDGFPGGYVRLYVVKGSGEAASQFAQYSTTFKRRARFAFSVPAG
jgi:hypothetical protein